MYGRSPERGRWHKVADGRTLCGQGRGGGRVSEDWYLLDRLPPRHDQHCAICFRFHDQVPAEDEPVLVKPPAAWDLDRFIDGL